MFRQRQYFDHFQPMKRTISYDGFYWASSLSIVYLLLVIENVLKLLKKNQLAMFFASILSSENDSLSVIPNVNA